MAAMSNKKFGIKYKLFKLLIHFTTIFKIAQDSDQVFILNLLNNWHKKHISHYFIPNEIIEFGKEAILHSYQATSKQLQLHDQN